MAPPDAGKSGNTPGQTQNPPRLRAVKPAEAERAPRSLERPPHNLPTELSSFVGREKELPEVRRLCSNNRLLTLTGSGGCGKTRLALAAASELVEKFDDGVWMVELASLAEPSLVPQAVAFTLGVRERPVNSLTEALSDYLRTRNLLLILDNCEHLIEACAELVEALLRSCPELRVLATSREALGITGEIAWPVPSLSLPDLRRLPDLESLPRYESARLFVERTAAVRPDFTLTEQNAPAVAQSLLPVGRHPPGHRAGGRQDEGDAGGGDRPPASTTASDCSRPAAGRRCPVTVPCTRRWTGATSCFGRKERVLFRRLSVFAGSFTLEAAESVCAGEELQRDEVLESALATGRQVAGGGAGARTGRRATACWRRSASTGGRGSRSRASQHMSASGTRGTTWRWRKRPSRS